MMRNSEKLIQKLRESRNLTDTEFRLLLMDDTCNKILAQHADAVRREQYGTAVYLRGLIEFTNYCKNDCFYCGIRHSNTNAVRYRLTKEEILECCEEGYALGFRTFVLQGGEDPYFTDIRLCEIISVIRVKYPDCAITLSIGEKSRESYQAYFDAGANRYLLRHETADIAHYTKLHPSGMSCKKRKNCLFQLREIGYQVGAGMMIGAPYQTLDHLIEDLRFLQELNPQMIGIGPFLSHKDTPFRDFHNGELESVLKLLGILRLMFPKVLLPATTALGTLHPEGRELGLQMGANVIMPNLSPMSVRRKYMLYDNKICTGDESAQQYRALARRVESVGYHVEMGRGDAKGFELS
ncbi:MAG: [FeFe] hydrogenase H-cluster radical SAM maturase HydE [Oscillospiraceae bacterium]|nr:[FeFe] hydrogenase H-cluster radical SAM maturase HydE [Oscillospiraceae bacterium]